MDGGVLAPARVRRGRRPNAQRERSQVHPHPRRPIRAPPLLSPHRSGDRAQARLRGPDGQDVREPQGGRDRTAGTRELPLYDITTGTGDFIANGVVSHNCFARPTHKYLDFNAGRDFEREIVVKVNAPELLRAELARPKWTHEHVALGTNTDPYQWVEGRYKLMPGIWEAMRDAANPCSVLTKSPLLLRDLPLMKQIAAADGVQRRTVGADARRAGVAGDRAALAKPAGAARGGGRADPRRHQDGGAGGAADAGNQRRARAGGEDPGACLGGGRGVRDRHRAPPARRGAGPVLRMASEPSPGSGRSLQAAVSAGRVRPSR